MGQSKLNLNSQLLQKQSNSENVVEILYQKMGNRWFAFSLINEEVFVGSLVEEDLNTFESQYIRLKKMDKLS